MQLAAQRPLIPAGSPGYLFMPPPTEDSVTITWTTVGYYGHPMGTDFRGTAYRPPHGAWVYGVALATDELERYPYLWVYLMQDRLVDSINHCYAIDTVAGELFCFIERNPVSYADFGFGSGNSVVVPCYEFYFSEPVLVPAGTRFYVGVSQSPYNVYNHFRKDTFYYPIMYYRTPRFTSIKRRHLAQGCQWGWDGLDSTWNLLKVRIPGLVDWECGRCYTPLPDPELGDLSYYRKYLCYGFFPIVRPPEDSSRIFPRHELPLRPGAVSGFHLTGLDSAHASFMWDTMQPSDWGPVGVNVNAYQVNYAPYMQEYDEGDTITVTSDTCTLFMDFDTTVMYKARCRARSLHICDIHWSEVWGDWSDEVYFHTGVGVSDTVPLPRMCRRVEGLRYEGSASGWPRFKWDRCDGQDLFEVQYALAGSGDWRIESTTASPECYLFASIDPRMRYEVRVRAHCNHHCHIHDTLLLSGWSDTVEFCLQQEGVDEAATIEGKGLFALAPNPAHGTVAVRPTMEGGEYPALLTVNDTKGSEVMRRTLADDTPQTLDLSTLPSGSYLVTLTTRSRKTETQRLVVE